MIVTLLAWQPLDTEIQAVTLDVPNDAAAVAAVDHILSLLGAGGVCVAVEGIPSAVEAEAAIGLAIAS